MPKPTGEELALLKAIASAPDDDLPRLVYADWLDEHGRSERAEFIRLQTANERPMCGWDRRQAESRIKELFDEHAASWARELPRWVRMWYRERNGRMPEYRRGFIEELSVYFSPFVRFGGELLDRTPVSHLALCEVRGWPPNFGSAGGWSGCDVWIWTASGSARRGRRHWPTTGT